MITADRLPPEVLAAMPDIVWEASNAAFKLIANRLALLGYPVTGDFTPGETLDIERTFELFVWAMARNNDDINAMEGDACPAP